MDPLSRFRELVNGPEPALPLDEAAMQIAAQGHPPLEVGAELARLDALAARCRQPTVERLMELLFAEEGFRGDVDTYGDPRNSFLPDVLDRRLGIPITLSVVTMEVGRRVGLVLHGVGMPGHFLVRHDDPVAGARYFDAFAGGTMLDEAGCVARFRAAVGPAYPWDPSFLAPVGPRQILARMLANLRQHYLAASDPIALSWVVQWRQAIPGSDPGELSAVADALARHAKFAEAAALLEASDRRGDALQYRSRLN